MIFVGDIAIPFKEAITIHDFPEDLLRKNWFGNLEGAIIQNASNLEKKNVVFNGGSGIDWLSNKFKFAGLGLANNHIFDTGSFSETALFLTKMKIPFCGIGRSLNDASQPLVLEEEGNQIVILNFGWEVIQCKTTNGAKTGVNPLRKNHVLETFERTKLKYPNSNIVPFMHWSYELESEPQPFERQLARKLIEKGAAGVIGCHPHRIGGFELFMGKPIIYSLGNWMFKQNYYHDGKLSFPDFCNNELALEWNFESNEIFFHFFNYNKADSSLSYLYTEDINSSTMSGYTKYRDYSNQAYKKWYRKNHYHRNKGLPIYYWEDSRLQTVLKNTINKVRDFFVQLVHQLR